MSEEILNQFILTNDTFKIHQQLQNPIYLDVQTYDYFLRLLTVQFSNVVPNIVEDMKFEGNVIITPGIYEVTQIIDKFNSTGNGTLVLSTSDGKISYTNDTGSDITFSATESDNNLLISPIIGFDSSQIVSQTVLSGTTITANNVSQIQDYNYFVLSSGNIQGITYTSFNGSKLNPSNILYPFSSALAPFQFKTWTSVQPVDFKLSMDYLNYLDFEIKDGYNRPITKLMAGTDFMITVQIIKKRKIY